MNNKSQQYFLAILVVVVVLTVLRVAEAVILPIVIALLLALALSPVLRFMHKYKIPSFISIPLVIIILFVFISLIGVFIYSSTMGFARQFPKYEARYNELVKFISIDILERFNLNENLFQDFDWVSPIRSSLLNISSTFMSIIGYFGIILLLLIFLLFESFHIKKRFQYAYHSETSIRVLRIIDDIMQQISHYLAIKTFISLLTGFITWISFSIIGLDFALLWGVLAFLFNYIPNIGSFFIIVFSILWSFIQFFPQPGPIVAVIITISLIQLILGQFLDPNLQGNRLNISPFIIILSLMLWGWLWGIPGAFISVPITAAIKIVFQNIPSLKPISIMMESKRRDPI